MCVCVCVCVCVCARAHAHVHAYVCLCGTHCIDAGPVVRDSIISWTLTPTTLTLTILPNISFTAIVVGTQSLEGNTYPVLLFHLPSFSFLSVSITHSQLMLTCRDFLGMLTSTTQPLSDIHNVLHTHHIYSCCTIAQWWFELHWQS